ncbi:hypothetical protein ACFPYJ_10125 [Paenibacillus solisilvae]|uniref:DUF2568 domain-containing protein n=1 Tax=Paenibacillus solisilvae TaxID=2486751 RepID=A0ABW0VUC5_9BACL
MGYILCTGKSMHMLETAWAFFTIALGLVFTPLFYKHFFMLAGDRGGIYLEAGFLIMVSGLMVIMIHSYQALPFLGMISLGFFFLGYVRLQELLLP